MIGLSPASTESVNEETMENLKEHGYVSDASDISYSTSSRSRSVTPHLHDVIDLSQASTESVSEEIMENGDRFPSSSSGNGASNNADDNKQVFQKGLLSSKLLTGVTGGHYLNLC